MILTHETSVRSRVGLVNLALTRAIDYANYANNESQNHEEDADHLL